MDNEKQERRQYVRIEKHFIISYYDKNDPGQRHDISQLKNISLGGMCFIAARRYEPQTKLGIDLKTPYFSGSAHMGGTVLESHEKIAGMLYETRLVFDKLTDQAELVLRKIIETFSKIKEAEQQKE